MQHLQLDSSERSSLERKNSCILCLLPWKKLLTRCSEVVWWELQLSNEEWLGQVIMKLQIGSRTNQEFVVNVGTYQGSVLNSLLFIIVQWTLNLTNLNSTDFRFKGQNPLLLNHLHVGKNTMLPVADVASRGSGSAI